ncbi:hypothetical protein BCR33DRAFT_775345 [Rhizoclosmatium globosum]|uniref:Ubiquitin-like domain-containing protein n=1 Tax=Rhizoclosmatium globosum TaxID=329046 RepID=A0A1Y2AL90_9FUNG|nr:hypothetical protein BCR33DRAFT_775345 [Rhizoclosmatium globosum]|eukprot:ORY23339.1 hypothetical protein BCR33DRAFT_775345 [Rhizoclosmatium globosum]
MTSTPSTISITIKTAASDQADFTATVPVNTTAAEFKAHLFVAHPLRPPPSSQRLVCAGKLVCDSDKVGDLVGVVHLVVAVVDSGSGSVVGAGAGVGGGKTDEKKKKELMKEDHLKSHMDDMVRRFELSLALPPPVVVLVEYWEASLAPNGGASLHSQVPQQPQQSNIASTTASSSSIPVSSSTSNVIQQTPRSIELPSPTPSITAPVPSPPSPTPSSSSTPRSTTSTACTTTSTTTAATTPRGIAGNLAGFLQNLFADHDDDEFGDAAALLAVQQQQQALAAAGVQGANNDAALQIALRRRVEHPVYLLIKLCFLVYMITRGKITNRSMIIISAASLFWLFQLRAWWIQQYPVLPAQQQRRASVVAAVQQQVALETGGHWEPSLFQEVYYFVHDFFASLFPESDDYLYNRVPRDQEQQQQGMQQQQPAMAFM